MADKKKIYMNIIKGKGINMLFFFLDAGMRVGGKKVKLLTKSVQSWQTIISPLGIRSLGYIVGNI